VAHVLRGFFRFDNLFGTTIALFLLDSVKLQINECNEKECFNMAIDRERFESNGNYATYDPYRNQPLVDFKVPVFVLQCRACGFEPEDIITPPSICPKCHSKSWERFAKPGSILENADRYEVKKKTWNKVTRTAS